MGKGDGRDDAIEEVGGVMEDEGVETHLKKEVEEGERRRESPHPTPQPPKQPARTKAYG